MDELQPTPIDSPKQSPMRNKIIGIGVFLLILLFFGFLGNLYLSSQIPKVAPTPTSTPSPKKETLVPVLPQKKKIVEGELIIRLKTNVTAAQIETQLAQYNASISRTLPQINSLVLTVPVGREQVIANQLAAVPLIQSAEPDYIQQIQYLPNDTFYNKQWGFANTGQSILGRVGKAHVDVNIESAWDKTRGAGVKVAILDTGLDMEHLDLASKMIAQKGIATPTVDDRFGHGTHVSGIIAASTNNNQGIAGACPECSLMIVKVVGDEGSGSSSQISEGIIWAADNGAQVINISAGGIEKSQVQEDAVNYAWNKGVIIVAAAGNNNSSVPFYPAAYPNVLSVGATTSTDTRASFSNYGSWVRLTAPGENIYSTMPTHAYRMQLSTPSFQFNYDYLSGTSMAAPLVTGIVGLLIADSPGGSANAIVARILGTADAIAGTGEYFVHGRVNAGNAIGIAATPMPTYAPSPTPTRIPTSTPSPTRVPTALPTVYLTPAPVVPTATPSMIAYDTPIPPNPTSVDPILYCLGSCPTPTVVPAEYPSIEPSVYPTNALDTSVTPLYPEGDTSPTAYISEKPAEPCANPTESPKQKHKKKKMGGIGHFCLFLLELLLRLLGSKTTVSGVTGGPCPTPSSAPSVYSTP